MKPWPFFALLFFAFAQNALAQEGDRARQLFIEGKAAADQGHWADAVELFEQSYQLEHNPLALYNLAVALSGVGRHREAKEAFERLLREHADIDASRRTSAERRRAEEAARLGHLVVTTAQGCRLEVDGRVVGDPAAAVTDAEVDPGNRFALVRCQGHAPLSWGGDVAQGERLAITLLPVQEPPPAARIAPPVTVPMPAPAPPTGSPWPWLVAGAGATIMIGGGALLGAAFGEKAVVEDVPVGSRWSDVSGAYDRARAFVVAGPALLGVGAAAVIGGVVWGQVRGRQSGRQSGRGKNALGWLAPAGVRF